MNVTIIYVYMLNLGGRTKKCVQYPPAQFWLVVSIARYSVLCVCDMGACDLRFCMLVMTGTQAYPYIYELRVPLVSLSLGSLICLDTFVTKWS